MIIKFVPRSAIVLAFLSLSYACGGSSDSSDPAPAPTAVDPVAATAGTSAGGTTSASPGGTTPTAPAPGSGTGLTSAISCDSAWSQYVAARPKGLVLGYTIKSETKNSDGSLLTSSNSSYEDKIQDSNDTHVVTLTTATVQGLSGPKDNTTDLTKTAFLSSCSQTNGALPTIAVSGTFNILEQGTQSVTVTAGTFTTNYIKGKASGIGSALGETNYQTWTLQDGSNILVKTAVDTKTVVGTASFSSTIVTELVKIQRP